MLDPSPLTDAELLHEYQHFWEEPGDQIYDVLVAEVERRARLYSGRPPVGRTEACSAVYAPIM